VARLDRHERAARVLIHFLYVISKALNATTGRLNGYEVARAAGEALLEYERALSDAPPASVSTSKEPAL
jgi:hypothetical protein